MHGHCGSFNLKKAFISLNTGDQTSLNVPTLSNSPRDLKNLLSLKTKKFWVFLYPRTIFFPEAQAEKADKRSWFDWAVPSLAFFSFLSSPSASLSPSFSLSLFAPSMATFRAVLAEVQPVPVCLNACLQKMSFADQLIHLKTGKCGTVPKSWHQQHQLLPNHLTDFMVSYLS